jgi:hypothetical protein
MTARRVRGQYVDDTNLVIYHLNMLIQSLYQLHMQCHARSIHTFKIMSVSMLQPLVNLPTNPSQQSFVSPAMAINSLVPHVAQDTSAFRNRLLLPARSASSGVVVGWTALHFGDFAEFGCVGLVSYIVRKRIRQARFIDVILRGGACQRLVRLSWGHRSKLCPWWSRSRFWLRSP